MTHATRTKALLAFAKSNPAEERYDYSNPGTCPVMQLWLAEKVAGRRYGPCSTEIIEEFGELTYLAINPDNYHQHEGEPGYEYTWDGLVERLQRNTLRESLN